MGAAKNPSSFVFIDQSDDATAKVSGAKRKAIRKQAMRDVGLARRERGGYGRINRRQLPLFMGSVGNLDEVQMDMEYMPEEAEQDQKQALVATSNKERNHRSQQQLAEAVWRVSPAVPRQGYEKLRMDFGFDILALSPLTTVHFSRAVATALANDPSRLQQLMQMPVLTSFLDRDIPARYNDSVLLQKATKWAISQAQNVFAPHPNTNDERGLALLGDLLQELQIAVGDEKRRFESDTLCASQLLAMLTLLEKTEVRQWTPYAMGASRILKFKGPDAYMNEFDVAMLVSYLGFIFIESLSRNKDCFLEEEGWIRVLRSMAVTKPLGSERHELVIELWTHVFPKARLFRLTTDYILRADSNAAEARDPAIVQSIVQECHELRRQHLDWRERYTAFSIEHSACNSPRFKAREFLALSFSSQLLVTQFILALTPTAPGSRELAEEVQDMAEMILMLHEWARLCQDWQCDVLMARKLTCARAAIATKDWWARAIGGDVNCLTERGTIGKALFVEWNERIGREWRSLPGEMTDCTSVF